VVRKESRTSRRIMVLCPEHWTESRSAASPANWTGLRFVNKKNSKNLYPLLVSVGDVVKDLNVKILM